jgi:demethylmenaquinone methyltransferase/2-methoxy-6-polyprenyl-1,4-benzoquinol methylase
MPSVDPELSIAGFYDGIYSFYGAANSFLTFGLDRWWRARAAELAKEAAPGAATILDVCCGTGDFSLALVRAFGPAIKLTGADLSAAMLSVAKKRLSSAAFVKAEAKRLPFPDGSFDLVTISFATRNLNLDRPRMLEALREFRRVLKPGGVFLNLETTRPENPPLRLLMRAYVRTVIGLLNLATPKNRAAYSFLKNTIFNFYSPREFSARLLEAGFRAPSCRTLFPGAAAAHTAVR